MQIGYQYGTPSNSKQAKGENLFANGAALSQKRRSFSIEDKRDTVSFAGKPRTFFSQEELNKALNLPLYATEAEFQEERAKLLVKLFRPNLTGLSNAQIESLKPFSKSLLTAITQMDPHSSKEDLEKGFKHNLKLQNPHESEETLNLTCAIIVAYPKPHPFEFPGRTLGESSQ